MSYLHCHNCEWEQDDFWTKDYNPIKSLQHWQENLLDFDKLDEVFNCEGEIITWREAIARECENRAKSIRNMVYLRHQNNQRCPKCGCFLDID